MTGYGRPRRDITRGIPGTVANPPVLWAITVVASVAVVASVFLFGLSPWVPGTMGLVVGALALARSSLVTHLMAGGITFALCMSVYIFGLPFVIPVAIGVAAIIAIGFQAMSLKTSNGDQNPIPYVVVVLSIRSWVAFSYALAPPTIATSLDLGDWLGIWLLGTIPQFHWFVNGLLFLFFDGTLAIYGALLVKRIINPVAN